jgi:hypothetical protein
MPKKPSNSAPPPAIDPKTGKPISKRQRATDAPVVPTPPTAAQPPPVEPPPTPRPALQALLDADTDAGRAAAALKLAEETREAWRSQHAVAALLARSSLSDAEKTALLGRLAVELARTELLLGMAFVGGHRAWEQKNVGPFHTFYTDTVHAQGLTGPAWCTCFAGSMHVLAGLRFTKNGDYSVLWSGYRLNKWANDGSDVANNTVTPAGERVRDGAGGSAYVRGTDWRQLTTALASAPDAAARRAAAQRWLSEHTTPQAGDILVLDADNAVVDSSHTVLVERFDRDDLSFTTIEGNANDRVESQLIDLTDARHVARIASLVRPGVHHYTASATPSLDASPLDRLRAWQRELHAYASSRGWIRAGDAEDSAHAWLHGGDRTAHPDSVT